MAVTRSGSNEIKQTVHVYSLDMDGFIFNVKHDEILKQEAEKKSEESKLDLGEILEQSNPELINHITKQVSEKKPTKIILISGSNRQSFEVDFENGFRKSSTIPPTGTSFKALEKLHTIVQTQLPASQIIHDKYLLADTYGKAPKAGHSYESAMIEYDDKEFSERLKEKRYKAKFHHHAIKDDKYKSTLIYMQIQRVALDNPNANIEYTFGDDREDILDALTGFYSQNTDLIPHNVTINFVHYKGTTVSNERGSIRGIGFIDAKPAETLLKDIVEPCKNHDSYMGGSINPLEAVDFNQLRTSRIERQPNAKYLRLCMDLKMSWDEKKEDPGSQRSLALDLVETIIAESHRIQTPDEIETTYSLLCATQAVVQKPGNSEAIENYGRVMQRLSSQTNLNRIVGGIALAFFGAALLAGSVALAVTTLGGGAFLSIFMAKASISVLTKGLILAGVTAGSALGATALAVGVSYGREKPHEKPMVKKARLFWQSVQPKEEKEEQKTAASERKVNKPSGCS